MDYSRYFQHSHNAPSIFGENHVVDPSIKPKQASSSLVLIAGCLAAENALRCVVRLMFWPNPRAATANVSCACYPFIVPYVMSVCHIDRPFLEEERGRDTLHPGNENLILPLQVVPAMSLFCIGLRLAGLAHPLF